MNVIQSSPGPWTISHETPTRGWYIKSGKRKIATVKRQPFAQLTAEADARLIAEAPAMLEALRSLDFLLNEGTARADYEVRVEAAEIARVILARIDGATTVS